MASQSQVASSHVSHLVECLSSYIPYHTRIFQQPRLIRPSRMPLAQISEMANSKPTPPLRELTFLRLLAQDLNQQLCFLVSTVIEPRKPSRSHLCDTDLDIARFPSSPICTTPSSPKTFSQYAAAASRSCQEVALELAGVELDIELVLLRNCIIGGGHEKKTCRVCMGSLEHKTRRPGEARSGNKDHL